MAGAISGVDCVRLNRAESSSIIADSTVGRSDTSYHHLLFCICTEAIPLLGALPRLQPIALHSLRVSS